MHTYELIRTQVFFFSLKLLESKLKVYRCLTPAYVLWERASTVRTCTLQHDTLIVIISISGSMAKVSATENSAN
jgi:hypothetical protein